MIATLCEHFPFYSLCKLVPVLSYNIDNRLFKIKFFFCLASLVGLCFSTVGSLIFVAARGIFFQLQALSCSMWDLVL